MSNIIIPTDSDFRTYATSRVDDYEIKEPEVVPEREISLADAKLLREYKKFLERHGLREALFCNNCFQGDLSDGCAAHVASDSIIIKCRCTVRYFRGPTY